MPLVLGEKAVALLAPLVAARRVEVAAHSASMRKPSSAKQPKL